MTNPPASSSAKAAAAGVRPPASPASCLCAPTRHPGSFRCSLHRSNPRGRPPASSGRPAGGAGVPGRGGEGRSGAGGGRAKGRSVRAHLLQMISPPSGRDHSRRRRDFQPRPSRLRLMNM